MLSMLYLISVLLSNVMNLKKRKTWGGGGRVFLCSPGSSQTHDFSCLSLLTAKIVGIYLCLTSLMLFSVLSKLIMGSRYYCALSGTQVLLSLWCYHFICLIFFVPPNRRKIEKRAYTSPWTAFSWRWYIYLCLYPWGETCRGITYILWKRKTNFETWVGVNCTVLTTKYLSISFLPYIKWTNCF